MDEIIKLIKDAIKKLISGSSLEEIYYLLNLGSLKIDIKLKETFWREDTDEFENFIPIGFIFERNFLENYESLYPLLLKRKKVEIEESEIRKLIFSIYKAIAKLMLKQNLNSLVKTMDEALDIRYKNTPEGCSGYFELIFEINGLEILRINPINYREDYLDDIYDRRETNINDLFPKHLNKTELKNIIDDDSFYYLNNETKQLITKGYNLIDFLNKQKFEYKEIDVDYSSLLLPFVKSLEVETNILIDEKREKIISLANTIRDSLITIVDSYERKDKRYDYKRLLRFCERIINEKTFRADGIYTLFMLLKYFVLGEDLTLINNFQSIIDDRIKVFLSKERNVINTLDIMAKSRNQFVHETTISSKIEFDMKFNEFVSIIKLLSRLRMLLSEKN